MIKIADTDGSGVVEFQEFMEMICDQVEVSWAPSGSCSFLLLKVTDEEIEEAFKMFDRDNSGTINHNEVKWELLDTRTSGRGVPRSVTFCD